MNARFDLSKYETVQQRLDKFHSKFPNGRIETVLVEAGESHFIIQALGYKDLNDDHPFATGYAQEIVGSTPVNKTSAIENCETSAIGRMLRNGGIGAEASREEMEKVQRLTEDLPKLAKAAADTASALTDVNALRDLFKSTAPEVRSAEWSWEDDGGFKIVGTIGQYIEALAKQLNKKEQND